MTLLKTIYEFILQPITFSWSISFQRVVAIGCSSFTFRDIGPPILEAKKMSGLSIYIYIYIYIYQSQNPRVVRPKKICHSRGPQSPIHYFLLFSSHSVLFVLDTSIYLFEHSENKNKALRALFSKIQAL